jgi:hypothetical protein
MAVTALFLAVIFFQFTAVDFLQDAVKAAPQAYRLQLENEWVKVTRVRYGPHEKIPAHAHSRWPAAYVYLNESGPIIFRHVGWDHPILTRPPTKGGSFRLSPTSAVDEIHEVENPTDIPSDFLRVEFKTEPAGRKSLGGRFYREPYPAAENFRKVQFENEQIRITRLACASGQSLAVVTSSSEPALIVMLSAAPARLASAETDPRQATLERGQIIWLAGGRQQRLDNLGAEPVELLRFDFKTGPVNSGKQQKKGS